MLGNSFKRCSNFFLSTTGFLKKLPQFPIFFGSGNFDFLIEITASEIFLIVGEFILFFIISFSISAYELLILWFELVKQ